MPEKLSKQEKTYRNPGSASPEEVYRALQTATHWLDGELKGRTETGPFSEGYLGEPARLFFPDRAYRSLKAPGCRWKWKKGTKLGTLIINMMQSDMRHIRRRFVEDGCPEVVPASRLETGGEDDDKPSDSLLDIDPELRHRGFCVQSELEKQEERQAREQRRDQGRAIACRLARQSGDPRLVRYARLAFELPDYRAISKRMKMSRQSVRKLESRLIRLIETTHKNTDDEKL